MNVKQLRYFLEVVDQGLSITRAASALHTSQPGISKQLRQLEEELGIALFTRRGKQLSGLSPGAEEILHEARGAILNIENIHTLAKESRNENEGSLALATTHTQSRYVLPPVIQRFMGKYPRVALQLHQGTPTQISQLAADGTADFAIATEALEHFTDLLMMPCYRWNRAVLVPRDHALAHCSSLTLADLAAFPLITYTFGFTGRSKLDEAFREAGLSPRVVFTAADADVIKTYVRLGLGVGIVASMAWDAAQDQDLLALDASHLFAPSTTHIGFRRGVQLRGYMYDFIEMFAPHLGQEVIREIASYRDEEKLSLRLAGLTVPHAEGLGGGADPWGSV